MKKLFAILLSIVLIASFAACRTEDPAPATTEPAGETPVAEVPAETPAEPPAETPAEPAKEDLYIAVISKGFQHQFWQVVNKGAEAAATDLGVKIKFEGPPQETDINIQVNMLKSAIALEPDAIALASLSTESVMEDLNECVAKGIPVVGFDSGVPDAPAGALYATASTDNKAAAGLAAENLMKSPEFTAKLEAATAEAPILIGVLSQDATSESIVSRTLGFTEKLTELVGAENISIIGHDKYKQENPAAKLILQVTVPASTDVAGLKAGAESLFLNDNIVAIYGSNEVAANGILAASNDGNDFNKEDGKYKDMLAIGFDAGLTQRTAVENGWFYGSVTQDPYSIGYNAVELAVKAAKGELQPTNEIVDTGAKWYNSENINDPDITDLVYK